MSSSSQPGTPARGSPPPSRPASPSPNRSSFRALARVGTLLTGRRNSSGINIRSLTRSGSKSSLRSETASQTPAAEVHAPSPVAESPAREDAANAAEASLAQLLHHPSPLSHEAKATPEPSPAPAPAMVLSTEPESMLTVEPEPVHGTVLTAEPQPFHEEPSSIPATAPEARPSSNNAPTQPSGQPTAETPIVQASAVTSPSSVASNTQEPATQKPVLPAHPPVPVEERGPDYFSWSNIPITASKKPSTSTISVQERIVEPAAAAQPVVAPLAPAPAVTAAPQVPAAPTVAPIAAVPAPPVYAAQPVVSSPPATIPIFIAPVVLPPQASAPVTTPSVVSPSGSVSPPTSSQSAANGFTPPPVPTPIHQDPYAASAADSFAWKDETLTLPFKRQQDIPRVPSSEQLVVSPKQSNASLMMPVSRENSIGTPQSLARSLSPKGSKASIASSYGQVVNVSTGSRRVSVSIDPSVEPMRGRSSSRTGRSSSRTGSVRVSFEDPYTDTDPFADPPAGNQMAIPRAALSPIISIDSPMADEAPAMPQAMPYPEPEFYQAAQEQNQIRAQIGVTQAPSMPVPETGAVDTSKETPAPISMPLPALNEVTNVSDGTRLLRAPSAYSMTQSSGIADYAPYETNERLPLLPRTPIKPPTAFTTDDAYITTSANGVPWPPIQHPHAAQGWTQHTLPDSSIYFSHSAMRVTTDIDMRNSRKLETVTQYLNGKDPNGPVLPSPGWELFLRDAGKLQYEFTPIKSYVNHNERVLTFDAPQTVDVHALSEDDKLDCEYRYWTYIESHPAHVPLPPRSETEAMDALKWSYTDGVLPSQRGAPPLFPPQECQNLMGLLRSSADTSSSSITHSRIVARVLLRKAEWRQESYRPNKPLPGKAKSHGQHRGSFRRTFVDIITAILCLGIPYLFMGRSSSRRLDEEGGMRSQGPMLVIGACACLVAAVILSASVTLLTLPGLDDISRLAGMIAILFSASSMVSAVVALFKYKSDLERTVMYVGGEGLIVLSRQSIVMSLPVVFLAWSIAAFVTGITFYSFRGVTLTSRVVIKEPYIDYTHWTVAGGLGGLAGMFLVFGLLAGH